MTVRDDLHNIVDQLADDELEEAGQVFAGARGPDIEAWQRAAVREALEYADRPDSEWVTHDVLAAWLKSWGTDHELPPPSAKHRELSSPGACSRAAICSRPDGTSLTTTRPLPNE